MPGESAAGPRVLHVNRDFSGAGAQRVSLQILRAVPASARFYCGDRSTGANLRFLQELGEAGVRSVGIRGLTNRQALWLPTAILRLAGLIRRERIDVVHSHSLVAGVAARLACLLAGVPCLHTFHGAPSPRYRRLAFWTCRAVEGLLAPLTRLVIFNSDNQRRLLHGAPGSSRVIWNFVPSRTTAPSPPREDVSRHVLFLGRFEFQKNPEFFVRLAARMGGDGLRFRMVGGGRLEGAVRREDARLGAGIEIRGFAEDPSPDLAWADCIVLCSRYESFSLVIGEALTSGCAVVSSRVDGLDDIWGNAVEFFEEGSVDAAAAAVRAALAGRSVPDEEFLARFSLERFAEAHVRAYQEVLGSGGSP